MITYIVKFQKKKSAFIYVLFKDLILQSNQNLWGSENGSISTRDLYTLYYKMFTVKLMLPIHILELTQEGKHMAYFSKALGVKGQAMPTNEKEIKALVTAEKNW